MYTIEAACPSCGWHKPAKTLGLALKEANKHLFGCRLSGEHSQQWLNKEGNNVKWWLPDPADLPAKPLKTAKTRKQPTLTLA